jgi:hypothetical protein
LPDAGLFFIASLAEQFQVRGIIEHKLEAIGKFQRRCLGMHIRIGIHNDFEQCRIGKRGVPEFFVDAAATRSHRQLLATSSRDHAGTIATLSATASNSCRIASVASC